MARLAHGKDSLALCTVLLIIILYIIISSSYSHNEYTRQRLFFGSCVGILCGVYVIYRLKTDERFQAPMMKLTLYRVIAELGISARFVFAPIVNKQLCGDYYGCDTVEEQTDHEDRCAPWSGLLHFFLIASELWFACIAFELAVTLSNPFSPFETRVVKYHIFCWGIAFVTAVAVATDSDLRGIWYASSKVDAQTSVCWISVHNGDLTDFNINLWILFYTPLLAIYSYGIYVTFCAYAILSHGIQVTFAHRARVLFFTQLLLVIYASYWAFLLALYLSLFLSERKSTWRWFLFFVPARGILGIFVLFFTQSKLFSLDDTELQSSQNKASDEEEYIDLNSALKNEIVSYATGGIKQSALKTKALLALNEVNSNDSPVVESQHKFWIRIPERLIQLEEMKGIVAVVDAEFRHYINELAESRSVANLKALLDVQPDTGTPSFSTTSEDDLNRPTSRTPSANEAGLTFNLLDNDVRERHSTTSVTGSPYATGNLLTSHLCYWFSRCYAFLKSNSILLNSQPSVAHFTEYSPSVFHQIRLLSGVDGEKYASSFEKPIKLHHNEGGASNALFFFSQCRKYIAKSCTAEEMANIRLHAEDLLNHFQDNKSSLITRIFGAYKLQAYSTDLYFIVTNNVLLTRPSESIQEKFDLKGSSVHRHMKLPKEGETVRCGLCGKAFVYSKNKFRRYREMSRDPSLPLSGHSEDTDEGIVNSPPLSPSTSFRIVNRRASRVSSGQNEDREDIENIIGADNNICPGFRHVPDAVMKDNDFRGWKAKIRLRADEVGALLEQLVKDGKFLSEIYKVMDYSLLVGVCKKLIKSDEVISDPNDIKMDLEESRGVVSRWEAGEFMVDYSYHMGIIDYQQPYNRRKKLETWYKVHVLRDKREEISCLPPEEYYDRFIKFMDELFF